MTHTITLLKRETTTKQLEALRKSGVIPGVLYGPDREVVSVQMKAYDFQKMYEEAGRSSLIDCTYNGEDAVKVLVQDIQRDPVFGNITHVDFRQIKMGEKMRVKVPLEFTGEAAAVTMLAGTLITNVSEVEVECLPKDLISSIEVPLASLATFEDSIAVKDLSVPDTITILSDETNTVVFVEAPRTVEEMEKLDEAVEEDVAGVAVEGEKPEDAPEGEADAKAEAPKEEAQKKE